jgi:hypothetical protein
MFIGVGIGGVVVEGVVGGVGVVVVNRKIEKS